MWRNNVSYRQIQLSDSTPLLAAEVQLQNSLTTSCSYELRLCVDTITTEEMKIISVDLSGSKAICWFLSLHAYCMHMPSNITLNPLKQSYGECVCFDYIVCFLKKHLSSLFTSPRLYQQRLKGKWQIENSSKRVSFESWASIHRASH